MRICKVCGNPESPHNFRHPFVAEDSAMDAGSAISNTKKKDKDGHQPAPIQMSTARMGDPVLRLALMNAGVISYEDLIKAEEALYNARASGTSAVASPPEAGHPPDRLPFDGDGS